MARNTSAQCRLCRRAGEKLFLKGDRCNGPKCSFTRRAYPPGVQGSLRHRRLSDFGLQMREKQKAKAIYGVLEKQFVNYISSAQKDKNTGLALLKLLETRLDSVVYRLGWASSHAEARQFISHGHIQVNSRKVSIPSYHCQDGDQISNDGLSKKDTAGQVPKWLSMKGKTGIVHSISERDEIDTNLNEQLIIEYYSR